jgi:excisionase family DNA binding protein
VSSQTATHASIAAQLLTADQLAERWQVPKSQVYRLARDGRIPVVAIGRYYRFRVDAIEAFEIDAEAVSGR